MTDSTRFRVLNQEFNNFVTLMNDRISLLSNQDKKLAYDWSHRLKAFGGKSVEDFKFRNMIYSALLRCVQSRSLTAPFNRPPTFQRLDDLREFSSQFENESPAPDNRQIPIILERSPDNGAFLVTQPVPKCGAFCYLAVVSRPAR